MFHGARHAFGAPSQHSFWFSPILKSRTKNHTVSQTQVAAAAECIDVVLLQTRMVMRAPGTIPTPELSIFIGRYPFHSRGRPSKQTQVQFPRSAATFNLHRCRITVKTENITLTDTTFATTQLSGQYRCAILDSPMSEHTPPIRCTNWEAAHLSLLCTHCFQVSQKGNTALELSARCTFSERSLYFRPSSANTLKVVLSNGSKPQTCTPFLLINTIQELKQGDHSSDCNNWPR